MTVRMGLGQLLACGVAVLMSPMVVLQPRTRVVTGRQR